MGYLGMHETTGHKIAVLEKQIATQCAELVVLREQLQVAYNEIKRLREELSEYIQKEPEVMNEHRNDVVFSES